MAASEISRDGFDQSTADKRADMIVVKNRGASSTRHTSGASHGIVGVTCRDRDAPPQIPQILADRGYEDHVHDHREKRCDDVILLCIETV